VSLIFKNIYILYFLKKIVKKRMEKSNFFVYGILITLAIALLIPTVLAESTLNVPVLRTNYSTTIGFNCTTDHSAPTNASLWYNSSGGSDLTMLLSIANSIAADVHFYNATTSISSLTDSATYNFTCLVTNHSDLEWSTAITPIAIDNTAPAAAAANFSSPLSGNNYSGNLVFNISLVDATSGVQSVVFNISNATGVQNATLTAINLAGGYWNITLDTLSVLDGTYYNVTTIVTDEAGNVNNTAILTQITFDNSPPSVSISCTPSEVQEGDPITCSCSGDDDVSGINETTFTVNPTTTGTGSKTTSCTVTNLAGVSETGSFTYTVNQPGDGGISSGGGGSSSSTTWTSKGVISTSGFSEGESRELRKNERVKIEFSEDVDHYFGVSSLTSDKITITITDLNKEKTISLDETIKIDTDNDGVYDISITLNGIASSKADLEFTAISEEIPEEELEEQTEESATISEEPEEKGIPIWVWVIIIVAIIVVLAFLYPEVKKRISSSQ
jgi:hypothetical protein